jgi:hypothetical protein
VQAYTTLGEALAAGGGATGVTTWTHPRNTEEFFARSDNQALADAGVPAMTVCVASICDYHRPSDHWEKIDLPNMERVVRAMGVAVHPARRQQRHGPALDRIRPQGEALPRSIQETAPRGGIRDCAIIIRNERKLPPPRHRPVRLSRRR